MNIHQRYDVQGEPMTFLSMQHMPLSSAYLCEDCNCIGNCAEQCPACASEALIGLAKVLNRRQTDEMAQMSHMHSLGRLTASLAA